PAEVNGSPLAEGRKIDEALVGVFDLATEGGDAIENRLGARSGCLETLLAFADLARKIPAVRFAFGFQTMQLRSVVTSLRAKLVEQIELARQSRQKRVSPGKRK